MIRPLLVAALLASAGCRLDPSGRCDSRVDCEYGLDCLEGVCAACRGDFDCADWQACGDGLCEPVAGRCDIDSDCDSWERCDPSHTCALRSDHCGPTNLICVAPYGCDPEHHCSLEPPACVVDGDCFAWMDRCDAGSCVFPAASGTDVLAWGTLAEGRDDRSAVARPAIPVRLELGFDPGAGADGRGFLDPVSGAVVYRHVGDPGGDTLRRFLRDPFTVDPVVYPLDPSADDEVAIATDACPVTWDRWIMQGTSGSLLYGCPLPTGALWQLRDLAGVARFPPVSEPLAWSAAGYLLALDGAGIPRIYDAAGVGGALAITNLPTGTVLAQRTGGAGFLVAVRSGAPPVDELWEIDEDARSAVLRGAYPSLASSYGEESGRAVLDADGALYVRAFLSLEEIVLMRPPGASPSIAYREGAFGALLRLDSRSFLLTRP